MNKDNLHSITSLTRLDTEIVGPYFIAVDGILTEAFSKQRFVLN